MACQQHDLSVFLFHEISSVRLPLSALPDASSSVVDLPHVRRVTVVGESIDPLPDQFREFEARLCKTHPSIEVRYIEQEPATR